MMPAYWLDANVLIQAANDAYQFDVVPGFWEFLEEQIGNGQLCMPKEVERELSGRDDEVYGWVRRQPDRFIVEQDEAVQANYTAIADWVNNGPFRPEHKRGFLQKADGWLIAHARTANGAVVTRELRAGEGALQVKIPNVCDQFGVESINQGELLRRFNIRLVRGEPSAPVW
jgi:Domain of unknown function (DUF4411)